MVLPPAMLKKKSTVATKFGTGIILLQLAMPQVRRQLDVSTRMKTVGARKSDKWQHSAGAQECWKHWTVLCIVQVGGYTYVMAGWAHNNRMVSLGHMLLELLVKVSCTQWQPRAHSQGQLHDDPSGLACLQPCEAWTHGLSLDSSSAPWQTPLGLLAVNMVVGIKARKPGDGIKEGLSCWLMSWSSLNNEAWKGLCPKF